NERRRGQAVDSDAGLAGCPRQLPEDLRHPHVVREHDVELAELGHALVRPLAAEERLGRGELDVRVADLAVEPRCLRPLGRDEHEPAEEDDEQDGGDCEYESEPPVDAVDHFAPPFGLKVALMVNVSPAAIVVLVPPEAPPMSDWSVTSESQGRV